MIQQRVLIQKILKQLLFYFPVTVYCCIFFIGAFFCYAWLQQQPKHPGTPFHDIFILLLRIVLYTTCALFLLGFITVFISWSYFIYKLKNRKIVFHISTKEFDTPYQPIEVSLHPILKPFLGYIKFRFIYDDGDSSDKIQLIEDEHTNWYNKNLNGFYDWRIDNVKEFRIAKVIVYFEDFLQFFSLAYKLNASERFYTPPQTKRSQAFRAKSRNTENKKERIHEMRRVEGDLFNFKKFDVNDDLRRIVWKIYAKNKELMIRVPEIREPYASHLYLYVSFFSSVKNTDNNLLENALLNFYKNSVWNIYKNLSLQNTDVRWISDQPQKSVSFSPNPSNEENIKHLIALSDWQTNNELINFVQTKNAAVVVVSSLADVAQVQQLKDEYGKEISFLLVPLSNYFGKQSWLVWLKWLFIQDEKNTFAYEKTKWNVSILKRIVLKKEKALKKILTVVD